MTVLLMQLLSRILRFVRGGPFYFLFNFKFGLDYRVVRGEIETSDSLYAGDGDVGPDVV